jgi:hypothetical protein
MKNIICFFLLIISLSITAGEQRVMDPLVFVENAFSQGVPAPKVAWIQGDLRDRLSRILGHSPGFMRVRYWRDSGRSVFILDEIGKDKPITTGFVVDDGALETVQVLVFRESRGWEVKYPFFSDQFSGARLRPDSARLDRSIDGITGATLSVRAVTRLAQVALVLDRHVARQ